MKLSDNNVHDLGGPRSTAGDGGGSGGFSERLARLEEKVNHLATTKDISDLKELIMENHAEVKGLAHENKIDIQQKQMSNLKWGISLAIPAIIAITAMAITLLNTSSAS